MNVVRKFYSILAAIPRRRQKPAGLLNASESRLRELTENLHEGLFIIDPQFTRVFYVSQAYTDIWGRSVESLYADPLSFIEAIHEDDREHAVRAFAPEGTMVPFDLEYRVVRPDNKVRWVRTRGFPIYDDNGEVSRFSGVAEDITERKQAESARMARLARAQAQLDVLNQVTASEALIKGDLSVLVREVTELAADATGVERVNVWLFNDDESQLHCIDLYEATPARHSSGMVLKESEFANEFQALKVSRYVDADTPLNDPRTAGYIETYLKPLRITAMLDAVIKISDRNMGLICIEHVDQPHHWEQDEIGFACQLADKLGLCISQGQRHRALEELQEAQRLSQIGNWRLCLASGETVWSNEVYRIFGRDPNDYIPTRDNFSELMTPASVSRLNTAIDECGCSGQPYELELEVLRPSQKRRWVDVRGEPVYDTHGSIVALRGTVQDISERKLSEHALHLQTTALEATANGIVVTDRNGVIVWANRAFLQPAGFDLEQAKGKRPADLVGSGHQDRRFYEDLWSTILDDRIWHGRLVNKRVSGELRTEEMTITPVKDAAGEISHFVAVKQDITDRLALEEQLHRIQRLESIGQLTGGVAHDFNNILTVVLGNAELLTKALADNERLHRLAAMITEGAQRGAELTHQLLAFARRQPLNPNIVDVNTLVNGMQDLLRRTLGEHIEIELKCSRETWQTLADAAQLEGALLNLAINARDAMTEGGRLTIEIRNMVLDKEYAAREIEVEPGEYVMMAVTDTGCGIASENLERVLEPFYTTKEKGKGTGLGLSMVYGFCKQSRGHLKLESELGVGTTVSLYLPRAVDSVESLSDPMPVPTTKSGTETILLVEDDDMVRRYAEEQLVGLGYRIVSAINGPRALEVARQHDYIDLLFTDMIMPGGMTGRQLADEVHKIRPHLPVLFTSGYSEEEIIHDGKLDQSVHLLQKPYRLHELASKVRAALDQTDRQ